ncbi:RNA-binding S4 domain-containing protein [Sphingomonas sp. Leaf10]|uniref:RNA-binding S4 domain-containing protein n=1 Tax=Sphingomonas sp. Leaf10 TaxID=1735676 RepID=UPI0006F5570B|nr:S4 domain-containing protein [Sphingomonas sp. Leaf10]KQM32658.1 RNA-binding protein [Sphingomonas sp. Leaf10]
MAARAPEPSPHMRLDIFLWYARLAKTRSAAQAIAIKGLLRIDGRRIDRAHCPVRIGMVIAFPLNGRVQILRVDALPQRRGPPAEALTLYTRLEPTGAAPVDEGEDPA